MMDARNRPKSSPRHRIKRYPLFVRVRKKGTENRIIHLGRKTYVRGEE